MPLDMATIAAPQLLKLDPIAWHGRLCAFAQAKRDKTAVDAKSRALDGVIKATQADLIAALGGAPAAVCGEIVVTAKATAGAAASITLSDGRTMPWSTVTSLIIGNVHIPAREVTKLFGGRSGSVGVEIAGA